MSSYWSPIMYLFGITQVVKAINIARLSPEKLQEYNLGDSCSKVGVTPVLFAEY